MSRQQCLNTLRNSITFQMSLGSKELFHTNFLEWLSIINWDCFLNVLHSLVGVNCFWWEKTYRPSNNNIEVRREYHHYDLSIYILVENTKPHNGNLPNPKWRPVFILENKVKSIPYQFQLDNYARKAFDEWEQSYPKKQQIDSWTQKGITFVLLTLIDQISINSTPICSKRIGNVTAKWNECNYQNLSNAVSSEFSKLNGKEKNIIDDYCTYICALHDLSQTSEWGVNLNDMYQCKIINTLPEEKKLRIADIVEKVHHERMLKILEHKLQQSANLKGNCEHWNKEKEFKGKHYNTGIAFYETAFSHGTGVTQVTIIVNDVYRLMIQLQGSQYRRCVILHSYKRGIGNRMKRVCDGLNLIWKDYNPQNKYGNLFKYQHELITAQDTVEDILNKMVQDLDNIYTNWANLKNLR